MKSFFYLFFISIYLISCQSNTEKRAKTESTEIEIVKPKIKDYSIDISVTSLNDSRNILISIETNFPDGTNLLLSVNRPHTLKETDEKYSGSLFNNDFLVNHGKFETTIKIDDTEWYNEHQRLVKKLPNDIKPIDRISDNIEISVLYTPARNQNGAVINELGQNGEFVSGFGVSKFGKMTTFRSSKEVNIPFRR